MKAIQISHVAVVCLAVLSAPLVMADTADIPSLTGGGLYRFPAAWYTPDGATLAPASTTYSSLFGDSAPRTSELDVRIETTFTYNLTNLRLLVNANGCGGLTIGQSLSVTVRKNGVDTALSQGCASGAMSGDTIGPDTDNVSVVSGDDLTISYVYVGATPLSLKIGVSLEGIRLMNITTNPVVDMTNESLETFNVFAPLLFFFLIVVWAEYSKEWSLFLLAAVFGTIIAVWLPTDIDLLRLLILGATVYLVVRAVVSGKTHWEGLNG